ncbi:MAG: hypothetical protein ACLRWH_01155 [Emergencia sp.]
MAKKENKVYRPTAMLKTVEQMSKVSGIGENKLRELWIAASRIYSKWKSASDC